MNRVSTSVPRRRHRSVVLAASKGMLGRRKSCYSLAIRATTEAKKRAYVGRKLRKRQMRRGWNRLISLLAIKRSTNYSSIIGGLLKEHGDRRQIYHLIKSGTLT